MVSTTFSYDSDQLHFLGMLIHAIAIIKALAVSTETLWCVFLRYLFNISCHFRRSMALAITVDHFNSEVLPPRYWKYRKATIIVTRFLVFLFSADVSLFSLPDMMGSYRNASYGMCYIAFAYPPTFLSYESIMFEKTKLDKG